MGGLGCLLEVLVQDHSPLFLKWSFFNSQCHLFWQVLRAGNGWHFFWFCKSFCFCRIFNFHFLPRQDSKGCSLLQVSPLYPRRGAFPKLPPLVLCTFISFHFYPLVAKPLTKKVSDLFSVCLQWGCWFSLTMWCNQYRSLLGPYSLFLFSAESLTDSLYSHVFWELICWIRMFILLYTYIICIHMYIIWIYLNLLHIYIIWNLL